MSAIKSSFADAAGGVAGSLVAMLAFYPIDVLKVNLQAEKGSGVSGEKKNQDLQHVICQMRSRYPSNIDFLKAFFKGLHFKTAHTTTSSFAYFFIYSWVQSKHKINFLKTKEGKSGGKYQPSTVTRLLLSAVAAMVNVTLTLPLDVLASRSQITNTPSDTIKNDSNTAEKSPLETCTNGQTFEEEKKEEEFTSRSFSPEKSSLEIMENVWRNVNDIDSDGDYDTANEDFNAFNEEGISFDNNEDEGEIMTIKNLIEDNDISYTSSDVDENEIHNLHLEEKRANGTKNSMQGSSSVRPLFRVDTLTQPFPKHLFCTLAVMNKAKREDIFKIAELWRGIRPSLLLCSNPSIHFTVFDTVKDIVLKYKMKNDTTNRHAISMMEAFLIGLVAKLSATIVTYPLIRAKVMLMVSQKKNISADDDETMMGILRSMFAEGGIVELYKGCSLQLVHTVLKSALLMMVREKITIATRRMILGHSEQ